MQPARLSPRHGELLAEDDKIRSEKDRRRHQRIPLRLGGRFLLDGNDHALTTLNVSCGGGLFRAHTIPPANTQVVCYLDEIGRIAGEVVRGSDQTFAVVFEATDRKRDKLADQLMWILNKERYGFDEIRSAKRYAGGKEATVYRSSGQKLMCRVLDISLTGAAFEHTGPQLIIGEYVKVGRLHGVVVRSTPGEFAIRIVKPEDA
ncbi:PilZ domain-containing protein [Hyphomonas sp. FCG-A18]|jgi:hypothetical protein|uniref:PilZ domain-containing protein n=1 Tax=Hyphomonas sp. FCG-A18 TaxID=3080019 RepID=UPI002B2E43F0|nr:PilZ domain-containing protein [Hyphomonas sp. FCG-A18]